MNASELERGVVYLLTRKRGQFKLCRILRVDGHRVRVAIWSANRRLWTGTGVAWYMASQVEVVKPSDEVGAHGGAIRLARKTAISESVSQRIL